MRIHAKISKKIFGMVIKTRKFIFSETMTVCAQSMNFLEFFSEIIC